MKINKFTSIVVSLMLAGAFTSVSACEIPVDVHPLSCPNPVNADANAHALMPAAMLGGTAFGRDWYIGGKLVAEQGGPINMSDVDFSKPILLFVIDKTEAPATAVKYALEDVAAPASSNPDPDAVYDSDKCGLDENNCWGEGNAPDGEEDLALKFKTQDVIKAIEAHLKTIVGHDGVVKDGETYCVTIRAKHINGLSLHGTDTIRINKKKEKKEK